VTSLIENFGALGVFLLMVPESACIPIPSEVTLIFSGVAVHQGWMSFPLALLAATAGNLVGSLLAYGLGASGLLAGVPVVGAVLGRWEGLIDRHGTRAVLSARLMPLARTFVSLPAGARRVPLGSFVALTTLGCAVWALAFILVGLLAGAAWAEVSTVLGRVLLAVGLLALAYTVLHGRERRKRVP
jgi:membrane protein DedA with SNARE-associated domain